MTDVEAKAFRELIYIAREIATCAASHPTMTVAEICGDGRDPDDELSRLLRAIEAAGPLVYPAWNHRHADEAA